MRKLFAAALLLLAACQTVPEDKLRMSFDDSGEHVTLTAATTFPIEGQEDDRDAVLRLKNDVIAGRDAWSLRFAHAQPQRDRVSFERDRQNLLEVDHSATIPVGDLQKFFYDLPVSTNVVRGDGWVELTIVGGVSQRATREQREEYDRTLKLTAQKAVDYFAALRALWTYLDRNPQRQPFVFAELAHDAKDGLPPVTTDFETALIETAGHKAGELLAVDWSKFAIVADAVNNPFPSRITLDLPTEPLLVEGFKRDETNLVIRPRTLMDALVALEGRWVSPDPLAMMLRMQMAHPERELNPTMLTSQLMRTPRRVDEVIGTEEVAAALEEQLRPAPRYRVRFAVRSSARPSS